MWTAAQALDLTYCVSTSFGANHAAVVQAGPGSFGSDEVAVTLNAALQGIGALTRLPCQKF